jgi:hypothetical protein
VEAGIGEGLTGVVTAVMTSRGDVLIFFERGGEFCGERIEVRFTRTDEKEDGDRR